MDQYSATLALRRLYKLENRSVKLGTEDQFIQRHIQIILEEGGGQWNDAIAEMYLNNLEQSI